MTEGFTTLIGIIIVCVVVIFVCREIYCWYTKQNAIIELLKEISKKLGKDEKQSTKQDTKKDNS